MKLAIAPVADAIEDGLKLAGKTFRSRLLVGTGKYNNIEEAAAAIKESGADIITVAVRRIDLTNPNMPSLQDILTPDKYTYLPNSAGCYTAEEAVRTLRLAREIGGWKMVKLEVIGNKTSLYPDMAETIKATKLLTDDGFDVMAYTTDDPELVKQTEDAGAIAVMPLAAPIGSGLGIRSPNKIIQIIKQSSVPVLVDAGIGTASDATIAMELGCDGVLMNTAIAGADDPIKMAKAMNLAVRSGRLAYQAGRVPCQEAASASSPITGLI
jgi:thiazole synthase